MGYLSRGEVRTPNSMLFPSIVSGVFFRPEETTFLSKRIDDVRIFKPAAIHIGDKNDGSEIRFQAAAIHIAVYFQFDGFFTVGTFRFYPNEHLLLPQSPLHEGRGEGVHCSGRV
jgi:hypothetical protein